MFEVQTSLRVNNRNASVRKTTHLLSDPAQPPDYSRLDQLHQIFRPTPWLFNSLQLMFLSARSRGASRRSHQQLTMSDGGQTALAWVGYELPSSTPRPLYCIYPPVVRKHAELGLIYTTHWMARVLCVRRITQTFHDSATV